ncbi:hypothetical protein HPP92_007790 [Vanilla planifolia]|uniref:Uncharacterized protein n=1 Tax=Vanilla planifolia TaxID=51239 RepID=A0A835V682_VANPL|nr:hypothetical protein HPP92_007790 [Vanilla planifolia]
MDGICSAMGKFGFFGRTVPGWFHWVLSAQAILCHLLPEACLPPSSRYLGQHSRPPPGDLWEDLLAHSAVVASGLGGSVVTLTSPCTPSMFYERARFSSSAAKTFGN